MTVIENNFSQAVYKGSRLPTIMADAAYELMQRDARECTGNFYIDEFSLREIGVKDFSAYAVDPSSPLIADLFVAEVESDKKENIIPLLLDMYCR